MGYKIAALYVGFGALVTVCEAFEIIAVCKTTKPAILGVGEHCGPPEAGVKARRTKRAFLSRLPPVHFSS